VQDQRRRIVETVKAIAVSNGGVIDESCGAMAKWAGSTFSVEVS
jgi:hypothetical protein